MWVPTWHLSPPGLAAHPQAENPDKGVKILLGPSKWHWRQLALSKRPTAHADHEQVCFLTLLPVLGTPYHVWSVARSLPPVAVQNLLRRPTWKMSWILAPTGSCNLYATRHPLFPWSWMAHRNLVLACPFPWSPATPSAYAIAITKPTDPAGTQPCAFGHTAAFDKIETVPIFLKFPWGTHHGPWAIDELLVNVCLLVSMRAPSEGHGRKQPGTAMFG
jgi:hypothetical protein